MTVSLHNLARHGDISWVSYYFAEFIANLDRSTVDELPGLSAALVSEANLAGHVCIELGRFEGRPLFKSPRLRDDELPRGIDSSSWRQRLETSVCAGSATQRAPLTLDGERLYLNRFWYFEDFVATRIKAMLADRRDEDPVEIQSLVDTLFADTSAPDPDQMNAVLTAAIKPFTVISGGPGSGKTSTVVRILALLLTLDPGCRVALAAPTGKAAARMIDSIRGRIDQLDIDSAVKRSIPEEARTIHRLLRYRRRGFDYDQQNPLPFDCVVIDEASMIDLKLTYHLMAALPPETRLILLGDRDQLSAVAAGNVLGDITGHGLDIGDAPIAASIALLGSSYRFDSESAIGEIAQLVNRGERT
jgi:exodeoxyribonuclease V alpha subunit